MVEKLNVFQFLLLSAPILLNAALIVWVALVGTNPNHSIYWLVFPISLTFSLVLIWHIGLIISACLNAPVIVRQLALLYGLTNSTVSFLVVGYCFPLLIRGGPSIMSL